MGVLESYGFLSSLSLLLSITIVIVGGLALGYLAAPIYLWTVFIAVLFWGLAAPVWLWTAAGVILILANVALIRRVLISAPLFGFLKRANILPPISETERVALEAGTTWADAELFSGRPDFNKLMTEPYPNLTPEEQEFMDGPVQKVLEMIDEWDVYQRRDLSPEVWDLLKKERFFGLIIPKKYGGREFSALAHSEVVAKFGSRSSAAAVTVMVPNSLGPAELLVHYGTDEQKQYYLPKLACGEEMPCFALTEPNAGSDASAINSQGVVFKGDDGKLYLKLNWNKRYITLGTISTLIGLAIQLKDPENLLGKGENVGITCVLVPRKAEGVVMDRRHDPMGVPFHNCPTEGHDVVVGVDQIIGGIGGAGRGWQMLMESLSAGRSISLPALSAGTSKYTLRGVSAYCMVRRQFGLPLAKFEGVEEKLAEIAGLTYLLEAVRKYTVGAVDSGLKPAVVSAIAKYNCTEISRQVNTNGMDIMAGAGIARGPRNLLCNNYLIGPIGITVEGANILTRTMIVFGQGAIRCHPYAYQEMKALLENDLKSFDINFWKHIGFVFDNVCRATVLNLTRGWLFVSPVSGPTAKYYRKLGWASAAFAILSDIALGALGGDLKRKEKLTGRYADILSWMYLATAVLRRYEAEGRNADHLPFVHWSCQYALTQIQQGFQGIYENFDVALLKYGFRLMGVWNRMNPKGKLPSDNLGHEMVKAVTQPGKLRDTMTEGIFMPTEPTDALARLDDAFALSYEVVPLLGKIRKAVKEKKLPKKRPKYLVEEAIKVGVLTKEEGEKLIKAEEAVNDAVQVDSFPMEDFTEGHLNHAEQMAAAKQERSAV